MTPWTVIAGRWGAHHRDALTSASTHHCAAPAPRPDNDTKPISAEQRSLVARFMWTAKPSLEQDSLHLDRTSEISV